MSDIVSNRPLRSLNTLVRESRFYSESNGKILENFKGGGVCVMILRK